MSKTFIVTGAAKPGYGEAITRRLLADSYNVIGTFEADDATAADSLRREFPSKLTLHSVNHSSRDSLASFVREINGELAGIVHAQFFFAMEDPSSFDHDLWDHSLAVNLSAPNFLTHELALHLSNESSVLVITSTEGFIGSFGASAYAATKAAIHNLVKSLANTLGSRGIRVNALAAGWIGGVMDTDEVFNMSRKITPLGRLGTPSEVASAAMFLLTKEASFVNGTTLVVDGGYTGVDTIAKYEFEQSTQPK